MSIVSLLVLAFALSLDGFGVGMMYGLRKIKVSLLAISIISCFSGVVIYASMGIGAMVSSFISPIYASRIGAIILICIGIWALVQFFIQKNNDKSEDEVTTCQDEPILIDYPEPQTVKEIFNIELRRFGLVIQILRTPVVADIDKSGNISVSEAILLGLALSLDAFGAGIGAALIGLQPLLTATFIIVSSGIFLALGLQFGLRFANISWIKKLSLLPGCLLIVMGVMKLL
jgi:putative sporulation protein YtaF